MIISPDEGAMHRAVYFQMFSVLIWVCSISAAIIQRLSTDVIL